jgi:uncharacterized protein YgbK (DUF1537 family)
VSAANTSLRAGLILIADDLTGACDAAVAFSCRGWDTEVMTDWRRAVDVSAKVVAINTESREIPAREAAKRLASAARQLDLNHTTHIFKKIDSVFRGNTFDEIAATVREFPFDLAILAPAYPALGRTSIEGVVRVRDIVGERTFDLRDRLDAAGLMHSHIAAGSTSEEVAEALKVSLSEDRRLVYCDADSETGLDAIVRGARKLGVRILWIGSAGLAYALALNLSDIDGHAPSVSPQVPHPIPISGTVVFFAGSDHPVTQRQLFALRSQIDVNEYPLETRLLLEKKCTRTLIVEVKRGYTTKRDICTAMKDLGRRDVSCLFMTGGDTATFVCRALGIQSLQLQNEFEPGLPRGVAVGGPFAGSTVILKSGGFGEPDVLCRIARTFQPDSQKRNEDAP